MGRCHRRAMYHWSFTWLHPTASRSWEVQPAIHWSGMVLRGTWNRTPTDFTVKTSWFPRDFRLDQCIEGHGAGVGDIHGIYVYIYIYDLGMCFQMSKHTIPPNFWRASSGENVGISPWPLNFQVMGRKSQDIFGFDFANEWHGLLENPPFMNLQTMENHNFQWGNPLSMAIFNNYVSHFQRINLHG